MQSPIDQMAHVENYERKVRRMFKNTAPKIDRTPPKTPYKGEELRRDYSVRLGAFDAFDCPSLRDGIRYPYVGPKPQCVGALKDKKDNAQD